MANNRVNAPTQMCNTPKSAGKVNNVTCVIVN